MQQPNDPDLAVVSFEGTNNYPSAELANSDPVRIGEEIYVYGYPGYLNDSITEILAEPQFSRGYITSRSKLSKPLRGYGLGYSAVTWKGMSGGPVFDANGRVVGIHGEARMDGREIHQPEKGKLVQQPSFAVVETGFNLAIPINTFIVAARAEPAFSGLTVSNTPTTGKQANLADPQKAEDFYVRGLTRTEQGDRQGAIEDYTQALALNPKNADTYFSRGLVRYDLGDYKGAIEDFTQVIRLNPKLLAAYAAYNNRAFPRLYLDDYKGAVEDFTQVIRLKPKSASAYKNRGVLRAILGDRQGAIEDFTQAIRLDPRDASAYKNRGLVRANLGDRQGTLKDLREAARLFLEQKDMDSYNALLGAIKKLQSN